MDIWIVEIRLVVVSNFRFISLFKDMDACFTGFLKSKDSYNQFQRVVQLNN